MANKKRVKKGIESLEKRKQEHEVFITEQVRMLANAVASHKEKIKDYSGEENVLVDYWMKEVESFEREILRKKKRL